MGGTPKSTPLGQPDSGRLGRGLAMGLVLAVLVYGAIAFWSDFDGLVEGLREMRWTVFAAACALSIGNYALRWVRWHRYLGALEIRTGLGVSVGVFGAGFVLTLSPGKLAELYKVALLREHTNGDASVGEGVAVVMAERLTDLIGMVALLGVGLFAFPVAWPMAAVAVVAVAVAVALLSSSRLRAKLLQRLRGGRTEKLAALLEKTFDALGVLLRRRWLVEGVALAFVAWGLQAVALGLIVDGLGGSGMSLVESAFSYAAATLGGVATLLPGGLGATELGLTALVIRFADLASPLAALAAVLVRAATLWLAVALGAMAWLALRRIARA